MIVGQALRSGVREGEKTPILNKTERRVGLKASLIGRFDDKVARFLQEIEVAQSWGENESLID